MVGGSLNPTFLWVMIPLEDDDDEDNEDEDDEDDEDD